MHAASQLPGGKLTDVDDVGLHLHVNLNADDNDDFYTLNFKPLASLCKWAVLPSLEHQ